MTVPSTRGQSRLSRACCNFPTAHPKIARPAQRNPMPARTPKVVLTSFFIVHPWIDKARAGPGGSCPERDPRKQGTRRSVLKGHPRLFKGERLADDPLLPRTLCLLYEAQELYFRNVEVRNVTHLGLPLVPGRPEDPVLVRGQPALPIARENGLRTAPVFFGIGSGDA